MLGIILLIGISIIAYYIKVGLFSEEYTEFDWFLGSIASLIIVVLMIFYGADFIDKYLIPDLDPHKSDTFGYFLNEMFFKKTHLFKIMYMISATGCYFIPLYKLIKNRYLKFSEKNIG